MSTGDRAVVAAIERWMERGLIDAATAAELRDDATLHAATATRRLSQYLLAAAGGGALLIAGGLFLDWAWPILGIGTRSALLGVTGVAVVVAGSALERTRRWLPASYLMQASGLGLMLGAFGYSEGVWRDGTPAGVVVGFVSLGVPLVLAPRSFRRNVVMPAVHLAMSLAFFAVFLDRTTPLSGDAIVWVLDGVLAFDMVVLTRLILSDPSGERHPWALNAFVMAMLGGFVLVALTAIDFWGTSNDVALGLDAWLGLSLVALLWGMHRAPEGLRRDWFPRLLALLVLAWIPLGFYTAYETLSGPAELALLVVGGAGVAAFIYGSAHGLRDVMAVAVLSFIIALWVWSLDRGGALGAVAALAATAGLLFWVSGRVGGLRSENADTSRPG